VGAARIAVASRPRNSRNVTRYGPAYVDRAYLLGSQSFNVTQVIVTVCSVVFACELLVFRWPLALCSSDVTPLAGSIVLSAMAGLIAGVGMAIVTRDFAYRHLGKGYLIASLLVQICPWLYWLSFDGRLNYRFLLILLPGLCGGGLSFLFVWASLRAMKSASRGRLLRAVLSPGWAATAALIFFAFAALSSWVGSLFHGAFLGAAFLWLAASSPWAGVRIGVATRPRILILTLCACVLFATIINARYANRILPTAVVRSTNHSVVHFEQGRAYDLRVTSGQDSFHVFVGNHLRFSTLDQQRWANALTQPALARLTCPQKALVFSLGEGLAERELLQVPCIREVTSVVRDRVTVEAARRQPWWRHVTADAWFSPRVHLVERDPAVWLLQAPACLFDLVIVDLPDPDDYTNAKYYSRFFYRAIRNHLSPSGVLAVQATSALRSPKTFATIRATLEAAHFVTVTYRVAMTTFGEWSFLLASPTRVPDVVVDARTAAKQTIALETFAIPPDALPKEKGQVSKLNDPTSLDAFLEENGNDSL